MLGDGGKAGVGRGEGEMREVIGALPLYLNEGKQDLGNVH